MEDLEEVLGQLQGIYNDSITMWCDMRGMVIEIIIIIMMAIDMIIMVIEIIGKRKRIEDFMCEREKEERTVERKFNEEYNRYGY